MKTLIYGGRVIDPADGVDSKLNVLLEDGKIATVCADEPPADRRVDAAGMAVCPGFVDSHVHEDPVDAQGRIYADPDRSVFSCMLRMGVTTVVGGNCGVNVCDPGDYLDIVDRDGAFVNVAMLAGHEHFRTRAGANDKYAPATDEQLRAMAEGVRSALDRGCAGVSFGIRYTPGMDRRELLAVLQAVQGTGKPAACHLRDDAAAVLDALAEFADAAAALGVPAQVSHIGSMAGFGQMEAFLAAVDARQASGQDIACDCYPYDAFSTGLGSATYDEGWLERYGCGYDVLELCEGAYKGQRCTEAIFRRERAAFPSCRTVCHVMRPEDVERALTHPGVILASDATMHLGQGHPRAAGTFPRLVAEYVRPGKLSLYDALARMTVLPASRYHLKNKGSLHVGADADIVIFDPERLRDTATFADPIRPPEGVCAVLLGGQFAAENGRIVRAGLGRSVRV